MVKDAYDEVYGLEHTPVIIEGVAIEEDAYQKASELWKHPEIDCIFSNGDDIAAGFMRVLSEEKKTIVLKSEFIERWKFCSFAKRYCL